MPQQLREIAIDVPASMDRYEASPNLPTGATPLRVIQFHGQARLLIRADPQAPPERHYFVLVQVRVPLTPREEAGTYLGSFTSYCRTEGVRDADVYHVFEVAAP